MIGSNGAGEARYERQRFEHLVLGKPRPAPATSVSKKGRRRIKPAALLEPGIEQQVRLRERWSHKAEGTPQTHEHASRTRQGALARLHLSGAITADQLAWALEIAAAAEMIIGGIGMKTASLEARVDVTRMGDGTFYEALGRVRAEVAYTRWRAAVRGPIGAALDMIARDVGVTIVARHYRMSVRSARKMLIDALDLWPQIIAGVRKEIDPAALVAAQAGLL